MNLFDHEGEAYSDYPIESQIIKTGCVLTRKSQRQRGPETLSSDQLTLVICIYLLYIVDYSTQLYYI